MKIILLIRCHVVSVEHPQTPAVVIAYYVKVEPPWLSHTKLMMCFKDCLPDPAGQK